MPWIQLKIDTDAGRVERLSELLDEAGALSVTWQDAADQALFEPPPGATPLWTATRVVGLFEADTDVAAVVKQVETALDSPLHGWRADPLEDKDWERAWMDNFHPMRFGERLWICPSWCTPPEPGAVNILLDPGLAFGTGTHPTTALCLAWLDSRDLTDQVVIDYGCGSGILAIAAALLGARQVYAVDNDPQALLATTDNAARNGVSTRIQPCLPEALDAKLNATRATYPDSSGAGQQADVLVANILAGPLISLAPRFAALLRPGGAIALSGILNEQAEAVAAAYAGAFTLSAPRQREDWTCLEGRKK